MNGKERFVKTLNGEAADKTPVFPLLMSFSAKRYGINYREFASNPHALAEAQLKAAEMFPIDAITACSDAFRISADLGGEIVFPDGQPPYLVKPLVHSEADLAGLKKPDVLKPGGRMADRVAAVGEMSRAAGSELMTLGWVDMPFAEACSMCGVQPFMYMLYDEPALAHRILSFLTDIVEGFAIAQLQAGAPMIGAGDAAASLISPDLYREFALPYEIRVTEAVHKANGLVKLHICGNTSALLQDMVKTGCDLFNVDHLVDFQIAAETYSKAGKAYKGNIDPVRLLTESPDGCAKMAKECLAKAEGHAYMLSAGCEIPANVPDESFLSFCRAVDDIIGPYKRSSSQSGKNFSGLSGLCSNPSTRSLTVCDHRR